MHSSPQYALVGHEEAPVSTALSWADCLKIAAAHLLAILLWVLWLPLYPVALFLVLLLGLCTRFRLQSALAVADAPRKASGPEWGTIASQLLLPADHVDVAESWCLMPALWLLLPFLAVDCGLAATTPAYFALMALRARRRQEQLTPAWRIVTIWYAWTWHFMFFVVLLFNYASKVRAYSWENRVQGGKSYWWHAQGVFTGSHALVAEMARSQQARGTFRACFHAAVPHAFPPGLLFFLPNVRAPDCAWAEIRRAFHAVWLDESGPDYRSRVSKLGGLVQESWKQPSLEQLASEMFISALVARCVFYALFGVWVNQQEAQILGNWRSFATFFVQPRLIHRFTFNVTLNPIMTLRADTLSIVRKYQLENVFSRANAMLSSANRRASDAQFYDEAMFAIGFAGIGGTTSAATAVAKFLRAEESPDVFGGVDFGGRTQAGMTAVFRQNPRRFIQETCRLSAPVSTFTTLLEEPQDLGVLGDAPCPAGTAVAGVIAMSNLDPAVFPDPLRFNPSRPNLEDALTWNGKAFGLDEPRYPRICPGRHLAVEIVSSLAQVALGSARR